jgi:hypothetical protein
MPPTLYIAIALLAVIVLRQIAARAAAVVGMLVALGIGAWGVVTYTRGGGMAFLGARIPPVAFFGFVAVLLAFEAMNLSLAMKRHRNRHTVETGTSGQPRP